MKIQTPISDSRASLSNLTYMAPACVKLSICIKKKKEKKGEEDGEGEMLLSG